LPHISGEREPGLQQTTCKTVEKADFASVSVLALLQDLSRLVDNPYVIMGSLLLAAGEPGMRRALPNARIMVHQLLQPQHLRRRAQRLRGGRVFSIFFLSS
jgi:hypothetical protein